MATLTLARPPYPYCFSDSQKYQTIQAMATTAPTFTRTTSTATPSATPLRLHTPRPYASTPRGVKPRSRLALLTTVTELNAMAVPAMTGESRIPRNG